uniref:Ig-like domain-containing protein n=1 Tax=Seriola lalandi dorsalis TaxID=1841481 RepID=A0A3B4WI72_SERLL
STNIIVVEWSRPELETEYVFMFRDGRSVPEHQHPSFQNRVVLKDRLMKDGDVSIKLKNVTINDTGTYECRVFQRRTNRRKRANLKTKRISTIYLDVHQSGESWCSYFLVVAVTVNHLTSDVSCDQSEEMDSVLFFTHLPDS